MNAIRCWINVRRACGSDSNLAWLAGNRCFNLSYEEICDTKEAKDRTLARLCDFLGIGASAFVASLEKLTPPVGELVEN